MGGGQRRDGGAYGSMASRPPMPGARRFRTPIMGNSSLLQLVPLFECSRLLKTCCAAREGMANSWGI